MIRILCWIWLTFAFLLGCCMFVALIITQPAAAATLALALGMVLFVAITSFAIVYLFEEHH